MCTSCYEDYGSPKIINDKTIRAADLVEDLYEFAGAGGNCHIVTDDWNLEDEHIQWCLTKGLANNVVEHTADQIAVERELLELLASMSLPERASALAIDRFFPSGHQEETAQ